MNREWHAQHPMPPKATAEQRLGWHRAHAAACGCRRPPPAIAAVLDRERAEPAAGRAEGDDQRASDG